jgi:hypothetical protein
MTAARVGDLGIALLGGGCVAGFGSLSSIKLGLPGRADLTRSCGHCQAHQSGRIGLAFDAPHRRDQPGSVDKRGAVGSQLSHLAVEFGIARLVWLGRALPCARMIEINRRKCLPKPLTFFADRTMLRGLGCSVEP